MKTVFVDLDESMLDLEDYLVERDLQAAGIEAIRRARRCGTDYVIWEDGRVKSLKPNETAPYEERALENLDRLNRMIGELQKQQLDSDLLVLNETPPPKPPKA